MRAAAIAAVLPCAIITSNAAAVASDDPYWGDFRTYGQKGCLQDNQGVGTVTMSMILRCHIYPLAFKSIYTHGFAGWQFRAYTTENCSDWGIVVIPTDPGSPTLNCSSIKGDGYWKAYSVIPA